MAHEFVKKLRRSWPEITAVLIFAAVTGILLGRHEPWRDEAQTWLVARDAPFPSILFGQNLYERHPALWYLLLAPLAKTGLPYFSQSVLHFFIAVSAAAVFVFRSPFSRLTKFLFIFSYYMSSEYALIARSYTLGILLLFALASMDRKKTRHPWLYATFAFFLFNTHFLFFTMAASLSIIFGFQLWADRSKKTAQRFGPVGLAVLGAAAAFAQGAFLPADHAEFGRTLPGSFQTPFFVLAKALIPLDLDVSHPLAMTLGGLVTALILLSFADKPAPLFFAVASLSGLFYILTFHLPGHLRHFGLALAALLTALWIAPSYPSRPSRFVPRIPAETFRRYALLGIHLALLLSLKYAFMAHRLEYFYDFSGAKKAAAVIRDLERRFPSDRFIIAAHPSDSASALLPYLPGRKLWYADIGDFGTYIRWDRKRRENLGIGHGEVVRRAAAAFGNLSGVLFLTGKPLEFEEAPGYRFRLLAAVDRQIFGYGYEKYYLYKPVPAP